jgi:hypothetical protein
MKDDKKEVRELDFTPKVEFYRKMADGIARARADARRDEGIGIIPHLDNKDLHRLVDWLTLKVQMTEQPDDIAIPHQTAKEIVAALRATPAYKAGRPKCWSEDLEHLAIFRMLDGQPVNELAREIAAKTGQNEASARRRLRQLKASSRFRDWRRS